MKNKIAQVLHALMYSDHRDQILGSTHVLPGEFQDLMHEFNEHCFDPTADKVSEDFDSLEINDQSECMIKFVGELTTGQIKYINNAFKDNGCPFRIIDKDEL